jgi:hypothetical protein
MADGRRVDHFRNSVMSLWVLFSLFSLTFAQLNQPQFLGDQGGQHRFANLDALKMNDDNIDRARILPRESNQNRQTFQQNPDLLQPQHVQNRVPNDFVNQPNFNVKPMNVQPQAQPVQRHMPGAAPQGANAGFRKPTASIKLSEHPACEKDVKMYCTSSTNNFAVLDCLQNDLKVC